MLTLSLCGIKEGTEKITKGLISSWMISYLDVCVPRYSFANGYDMRFASGTTSTGPPLLAYPRSRGTVYSGTCCSWDLLHATLVSVRCHVQNCPILFYGTRSIKNKFITIMIASRSVISSTHSSCVGRKAASRSNNDAAKRLG